MRELILGQPTIRISELDENSGRYEKILAAPSDEMLRWMWMGWSILFAVASFFNLLVFLSIVLTRRLRRVSLNQYLIGVSTAKYSVLLRHFPSLGSSGPSCVQDHHE